MNWTKVEIQTTSIGTEVILGVLIAMGVSGVQIEDYAERAVYLQECSYWDYIDSELLDCHSKVPVTASVIVYLGTDEESNKLLASIKERLAQLKYDDTTDDIGTLNITTSVVSDESWLHEWKKHFRPTQVGRVLIVPEWEDVAHECEIKFVIDPGSAFGTGQHATTVMCIEALQERMTINTDVLDIGCGSGILAIISLLLGANHVVGCDIDPAAVEVTRKNAALNMINQLSLDVYHGDILRDKPLRMTLKQRRYGVITANIVADVIIELASLIPQLLQEGGYFIASGIINERLDDVVSALGAANMKICDIKSRDGWCCVTAHG